VLQHAARRLWTPRLVATLALFVVSATFFCAIVAMPGASGDDRQGLERRAALLGAIEDMRSAGADFAALDARHIRRMERTAGLKDLRFESEPSPATARSSRCSTARPHHRLVLAGSRTVDEQCARRLQPLLALTGFAWSALPASRSGRSAAPCAISAQRAAGLDAAHEDMLTGLPNHRKMIELIDGALAAARTARW
jgi:hypothetical protein